MSALGAVSVKVPVLTASGVEAVTVTSGALVSVRDASDRRPRACENLLPATTVASAAAAPEAAAELARAAVSMGMPAASSVVVGGARAAAAAAAVAARPTLSWWVAGSLCIMAAAGGSSLDARAGSSSTAAFVGIRTTDGGNGGPAAMLSDVASNGAGLREFRLIMFLSPSSAPVALVDVVVPTCMCRG